jgi:hypothetical protein
MKRSPLFEDIVRRIDMMEISAAFTRLYGALADAALDLAERAKDRGEESEMNRLLATAQKYAMEGIILNKADFDAGGEMLARLAIVRQCQFVEESDTRRKYISDAWRIAENTDEYDVMTRARLALAREYVAQGDIKTAHHLLRQIIGRSAVSEVPYSGEPAKALLRRIGGYANW